MSRLDPDPIFAEPRLARIYDAFEGERPDLDHYLAIVEEFDARAVADVGCGTGTFACMLASSGLRVVGVDPAAASLEIAKSKPGADRVDWICGTSDDLPELSFDLVSMTGNVAQVFVEEEAWAANLEAIRRALRGEGCLVFEVRDPSKRAWENWADREPVRRYIKDHGVVIERIELVDVSLPLVAFELTYLFEADGSEFVSRSTLRFRSREEVELTLQEAGFSVVEVRDAPDRPGLEFVFLCRRI